MSEKNFDHAYQDLMGEEDEIDVFFVLPHTPEADLDRLLVLRVQGLPDLGTAWVH